MPATSAHPQCHCGSLPSTTAAPSSPPRPLCSDGYRGTAPVTTAMPSPPRPWRCRRHYRSAVASVTVAPTQAEPLRRRRHHRCTAASTVAGLWLSSMVPYLTRSTCRDHCGAVAATSVASSSVPLRRRCRNPRAAVAAATVAPWPPPSQGRRRSLRDTSPAPTSRSCRFYRATVCAITAAPSPRQQCRSRHIPGGAAVTLDPVAQLPTPLGHVCHTPRGVAANTTWARLLMPPRRRFRLFRAVHSALPVAPLPHSRWRCCRPTRRFAATPPVAPSPPPP